jgi:hypothetical protein
MYSIFLKLGKILYWQICFVRGVKVVINFDNLILSKGGLFVGKGYSCDGMNKLNINKITSRKPVRCTRKLLKIKSKLILIHFTSFVEYIYIYIFFFLFCNSKYCRQDR